MAPDTTQYIVELRSALSSVLQQINDLEQLTTPPVVQEIVLARRHLEDARMRLGVALTYTKGENPWRASAQDFQDAYKQPTGFPVVDEPLTEGSPEPDQTE
jgi:hypothetical protein